MTAIRFDLCPTDPRHILHRDPVRRPAPGPGCRGSRVVPAPRRRRARAPRRSRDTSDATGGTRASSPESIQLRALVESAGCTPPRDFDSLHAYPTTARHNQRKSSRRRPCTLTPRPCTFQVPGHVVPAAETGRRSSRSIHHHEVRTARSPSCIQDISRNSYQKSPAYDVLISVQEPSCPCPCPCPRDLTALGHLLWPSPGRQRCPRSLGPLRGLL